MTATGEWEFIHYSKEPLGEIESRPQMDGMMKPDGLWFSCEQIGQYGWDAWCKDNDFNLDCLAHRAVLELDLSVIIWIDDESGLDAFTEEYRASVCSRSPFRSIDWPRVTRYSHGLIIAPYIWSRRLHPDTSWYYGWDCSSGVVWNADAVTGVSYG